MSGFSIRNPYFIIVVCLIVAVVGAVSLVRLPVDMFPAINIPVAVVATYYNGMPPEQIESDITGRYERFFTLASNVEHIESRSLPGVSLIKVYFQPGTDADAAVSQISSLATANLRRLPPGTLPPVVLKFDASSLPVCLVTVSGQGMSESDLRDNAQYAVRNQIANVPGSSVPQPFGGRYRQIMVYVDPHKLEAHQLSPMDVVRAVNDSNLILPAGDVRIGPLDYSIYTNSQLDTTQDINLLPLKTEGNGYVTVGDVGQAKDAQQIQQNIVRVDGQKAVYLAILKQGGDTNTLSVVDGVKNVVAHLTDVPKELKARAVFDQAQFVRAAIDTLMHEGGIGLALTSLMVLLFLGSFRATVAVCLSIPLAALATLVVSVARRKHHQHHGAGRAGPGVLAHYRQLGGGARKHLSPPGAPHEPARGGRDRRQGSCAAGSSLDADHRGGVLSGDVLVRRQQVPVYRAGRGGDHFAVRFLLRGADGGAAL